jgi:geranylgeranyl pyrophosphate synthase
MQLAHTLRDQALTALDDADLPADECLRELAHKVVDRES